MRARNKAVCKCWMYSANGQLVVHKSKASSKGNPFHPKSFFGMVNKQPSQKGLKSHGSHLYPSGLVWYNVLRSEVQINMALQGPHPPQKNCKLAPCPSQKAKTLDKNESICNSHHMIPLCISMLGGRDWQSRRF